MAKAFPVRARQLLTESDPPAVAWAKMGDAEGLARLLASARQGGRLAKAADERDERGWTALMWSCRGFPYEATSSLAEAGQVPEPASAGAIEKGRDLCARLLIDAGADVDAKTPDTAFRPVMWAARDGRERAMRALLAAGADPSAKTLYGVKPVASAYEGGHAGCLAELARAGAFEGMDQDALWALLTGKRSAKRSAAEQAELAAWLLGLLGLGTRSWVWGRLVEFGGPQPAWAGLVMSRLEAAELAVLAPARTRAGAGRI